MGSPVRPRAANEDCYVTHQSVRQGAGLVLVSWGSPGTLGLHLTSEKERLALVRILRQDSHVGRKCPPVASAADFLSGAI